MVQGKRRYTNADTVYKRLEAYLTLRTFTAGDRIPPERELADALQVNRTTLRSAMHRMVKEGMLERHVGRGTFFKSSPRRMMEHYRHLPLDCEEEEIAVLRTVVDPAMAARAATRISPEHRESIRAYDARLGELQAKDQFSADIQLNEIITVCNNNRILLRLSDWINAMRIQFYQQAPEVPVCGDFARWREAQHALCGALLEGDAEAARQAVAAKLRLVP